MRKLWIGAHTSAAGGVHNAIYEGQSIGASAIQLFTSNQKQWNGRRFTPEEISLWEKALAETGIDQVMSHDSYLINLGALKIPYLNFHPGTAGEGTEEQCLQTIIESLLELEELAAQGPTRLLLEATAGQGTSVGHRFEHLACILRGAEKRIPLGVCIDTCHIFAAGYDIRTKESFAATLKEFDEIVGLSHLCAFHLNDSMKDLGSRVDRHAPLGKGKIGIEAFEFLMQHPKLTQLPKYLETPDGPELWKQEIALLKDFACE